MSAVSSAESAARCGFEELAEQINEAHRLAREHAESAIEHAFRAGQLLIDAKQKVPHGKWLPWLRENVKFSERSAHAYMRMAGNKNSLLQHIADAEDGISMRKALQQIARPLGPQYDQENAEEESENEVEKLFDDGAQLLNEVFGGDIMKFADYLIERPFCADDIKGDDWIRGFKDKLIHKLHLPGLAAFCLCSMDEYAPIPMLRLAPGDELILALNRLGPVATGKAALPMNTTAIKHAQIILHTLEIVAARLCGAILIEFDYRDTIEGDADVWWREYDSVRQRFIATAQARLDALREVQACRKRGELDNDAYLAELRKAQLVPEPVSP